MSERQTAQFDDVDVSSFAVDSSEQLGTKPKQWLRDQNDRRWLYKWLSPEQAARRRGEDWAEKVVGEIAVLLEVPCARIELAHRGNTRGILSLDVVSGDLDLVHGNELLAGRVAGYPVSDLRNVSAYRVDTIVEVLAGLWPSPASGRPAIEDFAGYLLLDTLVANTESVRLSLWRLRRGPRARLGCQSTSSSPRAGRCHPNGCRSPLATSQVPCCERTMSA